MRKFLKFFSRIFLTLIVILAIWALFNLSLVLYGIDQLKGQMRIVMNARPLEEVLNDPLVTDSIKQKIHFIESVKKFAIDSLGLKASDNYTSLYDQKGKPLLWVITASEAYQLKAYQWKFPMLGSVSYKGFFNFDKGKKEADLLKAQGFDTDYDDVSAWSTLGWFHDPILSNMLGRTKGQLAELIIHEMTHATLYVKSNVDFNENLASVCGEQGAIRFLQSSFGSRSPELIEYLNRKEDYDFYSKHMIAGSHVLDSLYTSMKDTLVIVKKTEKEKMIRKIITSLDTLPFHSPRYHKIFKDNLPNNSYFLSFIRYDAQKDEMKKELVTKHGGSIRSYLDYLKSKN